MKPKKLLAAVASVIMAISSFATRANGRDKPNIVVYGQNSPDWNRKLGVRATRTSCSGEPQACIQAARKLLQGQHTSRLYLNLPVDAEKVLRYAIYYSQASREYSWIYEVDVDDFTDQFNAWCKFSRLPCDKLLNQIIDATKSENPNLRFGVTLYDDQLASLLANARFTSTLRQRIDSVHLYIHKRADWPSFEKCVQQIRDNFPNADVISGSYAYDRIDYERCPGCSLIKAREMQKETLTMQVRLLKGGAINGIEFYPGLFGLEDKWTGWKDPRQCNPQRRQSCIEQTKLMHADAFMILRDVVDQER